MTDYLRRFHGAFPTFDDWLAYQRERNRETRMLYDYAAGPAEWIPPREAGLQAWDTWAEQQPVHIQQAMFHAAGQYERELTDWCLGDEFPAWGQPA